MKRILVNKKLCVSCRVCEIVCAAQRYNAFNHKRARIRVPFTVPLPSAPNVCRQCVKPKCVPVCPVGAISQNKSGIVIIDEEKCVACGECVTACPFGAIFNDVVTGIPIKCDLCGGNPQCVEICPRKALSIQE